MGKDRSAIGRASRRKGNRFQNKVCKMIAKHFDLDWKTAFDRAGAGHERKHDAIIMDEYLDLFPFFLEMKYRKNWGMHRLFKDPENSKLYEWFDETREYTHSNLNPALVFSKPYYPVYIMTPVNVPIHATTLSFHVDNDHLFVYQLEDFLGAYGK